MEVSKQQVINGLTKYVKNEMLNKITDRPFKMGMATVISLLETKPQLADKILDNDLIEMIFATNNGMYDLESLEVVARTLDEHGDLPIHIGGIKFISPDAKELVFTGNDVRRLKDYIVGGR